MSCSAITGIAAGCWIAGLTVSAGWADTPGWRTDALIKDAARLALQIDLGDGESVAHGLGVPMPVRAYCTRGVCDRQKLMGYAHSFPDPPVRLPGSGGLTAQLYIASERPTTGTLAALDIILPAGGVCLRRGDVRRDLGPENFAGAAPGVAEPLGVAANYVVRQRPDYRTVLQFVFAGPVAADGCLAFVSIGDDNFGLAETKATAKGNSWSAVNDRIYDEDPPDDVRPVDLFGPDAEAQPLGLTLDAFRARFPGCNLSAPRPVEAFPPLTDIAPPAIPLLPVYDNTYLATEHGVWSTIEHGQGVSPALDATLVTAYDVSCAVDNPKSTSRVFRTEYQNYRALVFDQRILAVKGPSRQRTGYVPAAIEAERLVAQAGGGGSALAVVPSLAPGSVYDAPSVVGLARPDRAIVLVRATGPAPVFGSDTARRFDVSEVIIDPALWTRYSRQVQASLRRLRHGGAWTAIAEPVGAAGAQADGAVPPGQFLARLKAFVDGGDLGDYNGFARAMGGNAVLLNNERVVRGIGEAASPSYAVGLMPGHSLLDGLSFQYQLLPAEAPDSEHRLPPYHRKLAQIDIGNVSRTLDKRYCLKRRDLLAAFGVDQMTDFRQRSTYVHRFASRSLPDDTLYASFTFASSYPGPVAADDTACVAYLSLSQYRYIVR